MKSTCLFGLIIVTSLIAGCESKTGTGAIAGAGLGALAGGVIGGDATGALIGGAIGAAGGALIGSALDQQDREIMQQKAPQTLNKIDNGQRLSVGDIKNMSAAGISDQVIINQIQATHSTFDLSSADIISLKNAGVSQNVINAMIQAT